MADPLSIASGIAGLISLAAKVSLACYQYGCAVKGAPREVQALSNEVTNLAGVLTSVKALVEARGSTSSPDDLGKSSAKSDAPNDPPPLYEAAQHVDLEGLKAPVKNCYVILEAVEVKLRQASFDDDRRVQKVFRRLIWPFKLPETRDMLSKLERYKGTFISALTSTNVSISVQVLDVVQDIRGALAVDRWERQLEKQRADMEQIYRSPKFHPLDASVKSLTSLDGFLQLILLLPIMLLRTCTWKALANGFSIRQSGRTGSLVRAAYYGFEGSLALEKQSFSSRY